MLKLKIPLDRLGDEIRDLHGAENQTARLLGKMARAASEMVLRATFIEQMDVVSMQLSRLQQVGDKLGLACQGGGLSVTLKGLMEDMLGVLDSGTGGRKRDSDLIRMMQRVETYKIAGYGIARSLSQMLDAVEATELLQATLDEKLVVNEKLTDLLVFINPGAKTVKLSRTPTLLPLLV